LKGVQMIKARLMAGVQSLVMISMLMLTACGGSLPEETATPTLNADEIRTQAVGTFSAALTETAFAAPSNTAVPTLTPAATFPPLATSTGGTPFAGGPTVAPTATCYGLAFVSDVSVPDNTAMTPGQTFTKTWKVKNSGTCAWDAGFKFAFVSGDAMGGATQTLAAPVAAGAVFDISVPMTAPNKTGTIRGDWRMSTANGQFFGDQIYVQIVVGGAASSATNTTGSAATATSTATATATPTP
jgi:hypothetical protein